MRWSSIEIKDLVKAWAAISLAFSIVLGFSLNSFILSAITVGIGFIFHELGHKFVAQRYRCWAEFRADNKMLLIAIVFSFFGFVFAAPGAVMIQGVVTNDRNGKISLAGPLMNLILALVFLFFIPGVIGSYGFMINTWLGLFNLIPFGNIDGAKILRWNKVVYFLMVIALLGLFIFGGSLK